jgi:hypothetical protein
MNNSKSDYSYHIGKHQAEKAASKKLEFLPARISENWRGQEKVVGVFKKDFMKNSRCSTRS